MINYKCPNCSSALSSPESMVGKEEKCPICGCYVLVEQAKPNFDCPNCGSSQTQKASVAWESGTASIKKLLIHIGSGVAGKFEPPKPPKKPIEIKSRRGFWVGLAVFFVGMLVVELIAGSKDNASGDSGLSNREFLVTLGAIVLGCVVGWRVQRDANRSARSSFEAELIAYDEAYRRWEAEYSLWDATWVCRRCGKTFCP